jgi:hypothetical protein
MDPRERERFEALVTAAVDGELDEGGRRQLEEILAGSPELRREMADQLKVKEVVGTMRFARQPEEIWDDYRRTLAHRLERGVGWILFTVGAALLVGYGGYLALMELFKDEDVSLVIKAGVLASLLGLAVLLGSVIRERLFLRKRERYDEVER